MGWWVNLIIAKPQPTKASMVIREEAFFLSFSHDDRKA